MKTASLTKFHTSFFAYFFHFDTRISLFISFHSSNFNKKNYGQVAFPKPYVSKAAKKAPHTQGVTIHHTTGKYFFLFTFMNVASQKDAKNTSARYTVHVHSCFAKNHMN